MSKDDAIRLVKEAVVRQRAISDQRIAWVKDQRKKRDIFDAMKVGRKMSRLYAMGGDWQLIAELARCGLLVTSVDGEQEVKRE